MKKYILDACALISVLNSEDGAEKVDEILNQAKNKSVEIYIHKINLLEVYYDLFRKYGKARADSFVDKDVKEQKIKVIDKISNDILKEAGRLKAVYKKVSLADSILLANGIIQNLIIISADHHEFDVLEQSENLNFLWFR